MGTRVTQGNYQFRPHNVYREIDDDYGTDQFNDENEAQGSYEYDSEEANMVGHSSSSTLGYTVAGIAVGGLLLVCGIIGTVVGVTISQTPADNSLTYGQGCNSGSNQCMSSQGLSCTNGLCSCSSPYSWNSGTSSCTLRSYGESCTASNQCNSSLELTCTGTCTCMNSKVWNVSSCVCPAGTFLNATNLCQTALSINQTCTVGSNQCDSTKGLFCNNSRCQCDYSTKYWNINYAACQTRLNYSQMCVADSDCLPTLICPSTAGTCNCPLWLADLVCNCASTKYFNSATSQCVNRATFNGICLSTANYTCLTSLYCNGGTCACPSGTSWVAMSNACVAVG